MVHRPYSPYYRNRFSFVGRRYLSFSHAAWPVIVGVWFAYGYGRLHLFSENLAFTSSPLESWALWSCCWKPSQYLFINQRVMVNNNIFFTLINNCHLWLGFSSKRWIKKKREVVASVGLAGLLIVDLSLPGGITMLPFLLIELLLCRNHQGLLKSPLCLSVGLSC